MTVSEGEEPSAAGRIRQAPNVSQRPAVVRSGLPLGRCEAWQLLQEPNIIVAQYLSSQVVGGCPT